MYYLQRMHMACICHCYVIYYFGSSQLTNLNDFDRSRIDQEPSEKLKKIQ